MKKILFLFALCVMHESRAQNAHTPLIKIDYATEGRVMPDLFYEKKPVLDSSLFLQEFPVNGIDVEYANDSIIFTYSFKFFSSKDSDAVMVPAVFKVFDRNMSVVACKNLCVRQVDTKVRIFLFFKNKEVKSSDYFVEMDMDTPNGYFHSALAFMPERWPDVH